ncbi:nucleoside kinase [bacterium]|nr:nucleoside kinase [bacterium]
MPLTIPENTAAVAFENGKRASFLKGTVLQDILKLHPPADAPLVTLAKMDNKLVSLREPLQHDCSLSWIGQGSEASMQSYRATLTLLLLRAVADRFPGRRLLVDHSLGEGIYCHWRDESIFKVKDVRVIHTRIQELIEADDPIEPVVMHRQQAMDQMRNIGEDPLLYAINDETAKITFSRYGTLLLPMRFPLFASAGVLSLFDTHLWSPGMVLQFPRWLDGLYLRQFEEPKKLFTVFQEYGEWEKILGIDKVADLNAAVTSGRIHDLIKIAEGLHEKKVAEIADYISARKNDLRVILIAGPSSSGKTTFTKRLNIQLRVNGMNPLMISLDHYFLDRDKTPLDQSGNPDYESLKAIDIERLNRDLGGLLEGRIVRIPRYDFITGTSGEGDECRLAAGQPVLIEGIHGLNSTLTQEIPFRSKLKIYVSALTQMNIMDHLRVPTSDVRLLRRMIRDVQFRDHAPEQTILQWPQVREGEEKHIFPYQEDADIIFNSSLMYELCVFRELAVPLLAGVEKTSPAFPEARRLLELVTSFLPVDGDSVPPNSILGEFTGNSSFRY